MNIVRELSRVLKSESQSRQDGEYAFNCPKCDRGRGKMHLGANIKKGVFHCFKCGFSGSLRTLGVDFKGSGKDRKRSIPERLSFGCRFPCGCRPVTDSDFDAMNYLEKRGITDLEALNLGALVSDSLSMMNRIIFPWMENGIPLGYQARSIVPGLKPKDLYPSKDKVTTPKSELLWGFDACAPCVPVFVTEGLFDAFHITKCGNSAVAIGGSHITDIQVGKLLAKNPSAVFVMLDGDEAGREGTKQVCKVIRKRWRGHLFVVDLPDGKDPDDFECGQLLEIVEKARRVL